MLRKIVLLVLSLVVIDRLLKLLAARQICDGFFIIDKVFGLGFGLTTNQGIALSIALPIVIVIPLMIIILGYLLWLVHYSLKTSLFKFQQNNSLSVRYFDVLKVKSSYLKKIKQKQVLAVLFIIAGGGSNLIDRLAYGYVVDYWTIYFSVRAFVFNLADLLAVLGVILWLYFIKTEEKRPFAQEALLLNQITYNKIATDFTESRKKPLWLEVWQFKEYIKKGDKILDLGCGSGRLLELLTSLEVDYVGVDNSRELLQQAKSHFNQQTSKIKNCHFIRSNILDLHLADQSFEAVFMVASLHHLPAVYHQRVLSEVYRILKPGGYLLMTNFNLWRLSLKNKTVWRYALERLYRLDLKNILPFSFSVRDVITYWQGYPLYYYAFILGELRRKVQAAGFKISQAYYAQNGQPARFWQASNLVLVGEK